MADHERDSRTGQYAETGSDARDPDHFTVEHDRPRAPEADRDIAANLAQFLTEQLGVPLFPVEHADKPLVSVAMSIDTAREIYSEGRKLVARATPSGS